MDNVQIQLESSETEQKKDGASRKLQYWRLYLLMLVLGIGGSFQHGLHLSTITFPAVHVQKFVNQTWMLRYGVPVEDSTNQLIWSFIVSVLSLGGLAGSISSGWLVVTYGRKRVLWLNNIVAVVGALVMLFSRMAKSFEMILLSRIIFGYNIGLGLNVHLMYIGESSPQKLRGLLAFSVAVFISFGKIVGQVIGLKEILGSGEMWPYILALGGIPAILQFVTLPFFPESPRYLYIDKGDVDGTQKILQWLWQEDDLKMELEEMDKERESAQGAERKTVKDVLTSRCVRWQLLTLVFTCALLPFCGISAMFFYALDIFRESGVPEDQMHYFVIGIGVTEFVSIILGSRLVDWAGRKRLHGLGYLSIGVIMAALTVTLSLKHLHSWIPYLSVAFIFLYICFFGLGPGGAVASLPAVIFLQAWRPSAYVIFGISIWSSIFLVGTTFGYIVDGLGQYCFLLFVAYCILCAAFVLWFVPETKGKTIVEITDDFNKLNYKKNNSIDLRADTDIAI